MTNVKIQKLLTISRDTLEEAIKSLQIALKVVSKRSHTMWNILLSLLEGAKCLAGSVLMTKDVRLRTEYMSTHKMWISLHGVPLDVKEGL